MHKFILPLTLFIASSAAGLAQDLESILEAHYKAASLEKMQKIETIMTSGTNMYSMAGIESSFTMYQARPNKLRIEAKVQGTNLIQTYNGEKGWMYAPAMGIGQPKELSDQELETILNQAEFENPLWNYEEKGSEVELIGTSEDGTEDHLQLSNENGDVMNFYLDRKSHLITTIKSTQLMGGSDQEIEISMKDYKNVKGIPVSHFVSTKLGGQVVYTITIETVEYNKEIDPELFEKPVVE